MVKYAFGFLVVAMVSHIPAKSRMAVNYVMQHSKVQVCNDCTKDLLVQLMSNNVVAHTPLAQSQIATHCVGRLIVHILA